MKYISRTCTSVVALFAVSGCATAVHFESDPPGAQVVYENTGEILGTTPFGRNISDEFGWLSVYRFTAKLLGYESVTLEYRERTPLDAQAVIPSTVRFVLKPKPSAPTE